MLCINISVNSVAHCMLLKHLQILSYHVYIDTTYVYSLYIYIDTQITFSSRTAVLVFQLPLFWDDKGWANELPRLQQ